MTGHMRGDARKREPRPKPEQESRDPFTCPKCAEDEVRECLQKEFGALAGDPS